MKEKQENKPAFNCFNITYIFFSLLCLILGILLAAVLESNPKKTTKECS